MYDLLIKNGKSVTEETLHVAIKGGKIAAVSQADSWDAEAKEVIDLERAYYVSAGWIDSHVHCFEKMSLYYDFPDEIGVKTGVTTVIDAGSTGADNVGEFYELAKQAKTNVYALLNISKTGIVTQDELADLSRIDADKISQRLEEYSDFIIGIKARMSASVVGENDIIPLKMAKAIQKAHEPLPLMVHIGSAPPELKDILALLEEGDIVTHCFNGKANGILASDDTIKAFALEAYKRGVVFDIGHGTDSFNFHVAEVAKSEEVKAALISTDIYHRNRENGPVYNLATTLEKLLVVGYSLPELIDKITFQPSKYFNLIQKGQLKEGFDGDLTIFDVVSGEKELVDSNGNKQQAKVRVMPKKAVIGGIVYDVK